MRLLKAQSPAARPAPPLTAHGDVLKRDTLATGAHLMVSAGFAAMPFALIGLLHAAALPFLLSTLGLATGMTSLALNRRGDLDGAGAAQVFGLMLAGLVLTVTDPALTDFGMALALLGPIHAALTARAGAGRLSWTLFAAILALDIAASLLAGHLPAITLADSGLAGGLAFAAGAIIVAITGSRLGTGHEAQERARLEAMRHLIEHVQDAVLRFDADGRLAFASQSSEKLFGCPRYELDHEALVNRIHVMDRPAFLNALSAATIRGTARNLEIRVRQDDPAATSAVPAFVWTEFALSTMPEDGERAAGHEVVALLRDVTEQHDRALAMEQARRAAEEASQAKSRFLATIGHELRTPLNAIVGFSEMMASGIGGELSPGHREYAGLIGKSGRHLIEIVSMLLDMSRLDAGKFELETDWLQPAGLLDPCLDMVRPLATERGIAIDTQLRGSLPEIVADERACRQILINLLSNAIKFSHEGGRVTVALRRSGRHLSIAVTDRGIGMDAAALERLGEAFFQAQDGLDRRYEGTGLGLSIVRGLVDLHGGSMHAVSEPGQGTTMTVLLPINGPETKPRDNAVVTPIHPEPAPQPAAEWPDARRNAL